jgi:hypothetical protein
MTDVSTKYLDDHRSNVHTAESWARSITENIFNAAVSQLGSGSAATVVVDAKFEITAFEPKSCVQVCAVINGVQVCYHVNL